MFASPSSSLRLPSYVCLLIFSGSVMAAGVQHKQRDSVGFYYPPFIATSLDSNVTFSSALKLINLTTLRPDHLRGFKVLL